MFNYEFRLGQHYTGNWKSAISIGMHKKGTGEGSGLTTYKSSHKAIYDHQSRDRKMDKLVSNIPQGFLDNLIHVLFVPY